MPKLSDIFGITEDDITSEARAILDRFRGNKNMTDDIALDEAEKILLSRKLKAQLGNKNIPPERLENFPPNLANKQTDLPYAKYAGMDSSQIRALISGTGTAGAGAAWGTGLGGPVGGIAGATAGFPVGAAMSLIGDRFSKEPKAEPVLSGNTLLDLVSGYTGGWASKLFRGTPTAKALVGAGVNAGENYLAGKFDEKVLGDKSANPALQAGVAGTLSAAIGVPIARQSGYMRGRRKLEDALNQPIKDVNPLAAMNEIADDAGVVSKSSVLENAERARLARNQRAQDNFTSALEKSQVNIKNVEASNLRELDKNKKELAKYNLLLSRSKDPKLSPNERLALTQRLENEFPAGPPESPIFKTPPPEPKAPRLEEQSDLYKRLQRISEGTKTQIAGDPDRKRVAKRIGENPTEAYKFILDPITNARTQKELMDNSKEFQKRLEVVKMLSDGKKNVKDITEGLRDEFYRSLVDKSPKTADGFANPDSFKMRLEAIGEDSVNFIYGNKNAYKTLTALADEASRAGVLGRRRIALGRDGIFSGEFTKGLSPKLDDDKNLELIRPSSLFALGSAIGGGGKAGAALGVGILGAAKAGRKANEIIENRVLKGMKPEVIDNAASGAAQGGVNSLTNWLIEMANRKRE